MEFAFVDIRLYFALLPYVGSFLVSLFIGIEAWQRKNASARAYTGVALSQAFWTFGYIFELLAPTLEGKIFWDNLQFIGGVGWSLTFLAFTLRYTHRRFTKPRLTFGVLAIPGILMVQLAFTDPLHGLVRPTSILVPGMPFSALLYDITAVFWAWAIFSYGLAVACVYLLFIKFIDTQQLFRTQVGLIVVGNAIPVIGTFLTMFGLITIPLRDITPLTFPVGSIFVALGLFQYRLFDVKPIAHHIIIENMCDAVFVIDKDRRIVDLNQAAKAALPRANPTIIGQSIDAAFSEWPELVSQYPDFVLQGGAEIEVRVEDKIHFVELAIQPLNSRYGNHVGEVIIARDVTKQKTAVSQLEQRTLELEAANEQLLHLSQIKDKFVSTVSHELRTPITSLKLHQTLLRRNPKKQIAYFDVMERETDRLSTLIEDILALSRFDQNHQSFTRQPININHLLKEYVHDRVPIAEQNQLKLTFDQPADFPSVFGHRNFVEQAFGVFLTNAINYTPPGGQICISLCSRCEADQQWAEITIQDTGLGITKEDRPHLFTRFYRGSAGRNSGVPGTGLGLVIAKEIIERHNGRLHIQSSGIPGEGTAVSMILPLAELDISPSHQIGH